MTEILAENRQSVVFFLLAQIFVLILDRNIKLADRPAQELHYK